MEEEILKKIEDMLAERLSAIINYTLSRIIKPDIKINKVAELDKEKIAKLRQDYGIEGVILDVDETLRKDMKSIPQINQDWIENLKEELKIIIVSNGRDRKIEQFFRERGIDYIGFAHKPLKKNFIKACERINVNPDKVLVVGDDLFDDIYGGKRNKMKTVLVKEVEEEER